MWTHSVETVVCAGGVVQNHKKSQREGDFLWGAGGQKPLMENRKRKRKNQSDTYPLFSPYKVSGPL